MRKMSVLVISLILAGCGGKQEANQSNFSEAINEFAKNDHVCLPVNLILDNVENGSKSNPAVGASEIRITLKNSNGDRVNKTAVEQMDILIDADVYQQGKNEDFQLPNGKKLPVAVYRLSDKAKDKIVTSSQNSLLCLGTQQVEKITLFTEPTPANGVTVSKVVYDAKLVPEKWAEKLLKKTDENWWKSLKEPQRRTAVLVLTDKGWKDERTLH
jgi:hypothetical protein